ncbi:hypothetical protein BCON_0092g00320 [Botryotinia convoluta]|uniref:Uncharacterized protein n=1 Tax=Botryotinia convoluta TaxID=54673 RepID=A0A4Z1I1E7_9HELO|nr:hypothetical protein BCON_0092g00320 [Botryotinia convoluta]
MHALVPHKLSRKMMTYMYWNLPVSKYVIENPLGQFDGLRPAGRAIQPHLYNSISKAECTPSRKIKKIAQYKHRPDILEISIPSQQYSISRPNMRNSSHHSTSHHSTDRTPKAHRVDTNSSYGDGNISDSSTASLLGDRNKRHNPSGNHKEKYVPASGSEKRNQETGTSRRKEEERQTSNHSYRRIETPDQKAHEERKSSKRTKYPADPITLGRYEYYDIKIEKKLNAAKADLQFEERHYWRTDDSWVSCYRDVQALEELAKEIDDIKKQGLAPWKAKKALDELLEIKGHLLK